MNAPVGYVRACAAIEVTLHQPIRPEGYQVVTGRLLGAMYDRGVVLHYRVDLGECVILLAPSGWLTPESLAAAEMATPAQHPKPQPDDLQTGLKNLAAMFRAGARLSERVP